MGQPSGVKVIVNLTVHIYNELKRTATNPRQLEFVLSSCKFVVNVIYRYKYQDRYYPKHKTHWFFTVALYTIYFLINRNIYESHTRPDT